MKWIHPVKIINRKFRILKQIKYEKVRKETSHQRSSAVRRLEGILAQQNTGGADDGAGGYL